MSMKAIQDEHSQTLSKAIELIWREATLLDHKRYDEWLKLWEPAGVYVVPIDRNAVDFENTLNYIYDDHNMRQKRVERMMDGTAGSVVDSALTVRTVSRFVELPLEDDAAIVAVSAAQILIAYKRGVGTIFAADVIYRIRADQAEPLIEQKIVRLVNSMDTLNSIGFLM
jgi:3-phenylpropionate/cinnamic acid dioxygenase small subunit